jgi:DNA polymerase I-like protein with 3'-5' exonuclease and polymerase domains
MTDKGEYGFMYKSKRSLNFLRQIFDDPTKSVVFHNAKFDLKMLSFEGIDIFSIRATVHDTMNMSKVLRSTEKQHSLLVLSQKLLGRDDSDKIEISDWVKSHNTKRLIRERGRAVNFEDAPEDLVKSRVIWDVESTLRLYFYFRPRIDEICPDLYETERMLIFVTIDMEMYGVRVDITRAKQLKAQAEKDVARIRNDLNELVCPITVQYKKKGDYVSKVIEEFNPGSSAKEMPAAFEKLGIKLKHKTKPKKSKSGDGSKSGGGNWSFDEYAMMRYVSKPLASVLRESSEDHWSVDKLYREIEKTIRKHKLKKREWLPPLVLKFRELSKMVSTYYDHLINDCVDIEVGPDGREYGILHCKFNQHEAKTGRFSSSEPNLQNMPRQLGPRECFITRKGKQNWHLDYDQVEMRMFVHFARDEKMADAIERDIHRFVASQIYQKPENEIKPEQRKRAKGTNFGIIYGSGAPTQAETLTKNGLPTSVDEAKSLVGNYHRRFPSVRRITNELKIEIRKNGFVTNPLGRRYHISTSRSYVALNYLCQGTSADIMKKAMVDLWVWLRKNEYRSRIIMTIHDEIVIETPKSEASEVIPKAKRIMEDLESYFVPVTVGADVVTHRWSGKKDAKKAGFKFAA